MVIRHHSDNASGELVYATGSGRMCPDCRRPVAACSCARAAPTPGASAVLRVSREVKGRGGKVVTLIRGFALDPVTLSALGRQLKTECGTGGTVKVGTIELQGDHCERTMVVLKGQGHWVKRAGG